MSANTTYYLKFGSNNPVAVETHYDAAGNDRKRPFNTVGHLVAAFKAAESPLFDTTPTSKLALHTVVDGVETELKSSYKLSLLETGTDEDFPLIIKSTAGNEGKR